MREAKWTKMICKELQRYWDVVALVGGARQRSGLPDRMLIGHGVVVFIEFKGADTKLMLNQRKTLHDWTHQRRVPCFVARFPGELFTVSSGPGMPLCRVGGFANGSDLHKLLLMLL